MLFSGFSKSIALRTIQNKDMVVQRTRNSCGQRTCEWKMGAKKCPSSPVSWKVRHQRFLPSKSSANHLQNCCHYHHQSIQMTHLLKIIIMWLQAEKIVCTTNPGSSYFQIRVGLWPRPPPICCSTMQCVCCSTMQVFVTMLCITFVCIRRKNCNIPCNTVFFLHHFRPKL